MPRTPLAFEISLAHNSEREVRTRDQLLRILASYDVSKWVRTRKIRIEEGAIPFSHPVLRLNTEYGDSDHRLLSIFLHEQIHWILSVHWILSEKRGATKRAMKALKHRYPDVPVGYPEGARDRESSYLHLVVNYLELIALEEVIGEAQAREVFDFWLTHHYGAIYRIVLDDRAAISEIVDRCGLLAP